MFGIILRTVWFNVNMCLSVCVGHGFKLAPVVGKILSELALDQPPSYDLTPFSISRFTTKGKL